MQYQIGVEEMDILHYIRIHISLFFFSFLPLSTHRCIVVVVVASFLFFPFFFLFFPPLTFATLWGIDCFFFDFLFFSTPLVLSRISFD